MEGSKSKNKRRNSTYRLVSQSCNGLVHGGRREDTMEVTDSCF